MCDNNLGKLAESLRILGFDTGFKEPMRTPKLLRRAACEERFLLPRDHRLLTRTSHGVLVLENDNPLEQLGFVVSTLELAIDPALLFRRCSICNTLCETIKKAQAENYVFPFILKTQEVISLCPFCNDTTGKARITSGFYVS